MMPRAPVLALLMLCAAAAPAQAIDAARSGLLSAPRARPGCFAPLRLVFEAPPGATGALIESVSPGVVLTRQVNVSGTGATEARIPWFVGAGSFVRVTIGGASAEFTPPMPARPQLPSYGRHYTAVFAPDPAAARDALKPGDEWPCDFFTDSEAFSDWRMLDGYDAVLLFNPGSAAWPAGLAQALSDFASLGGAILTTDHFAPLKASAPTTLVLGDVAFSRQYCGAGAVYRVRHASLLAAPQPGLALTAALRDHRWQGAPTPPSGPAPSRAVSEPHARGWLVPLPPHEPSAPPLFFALCGLLLLACLLGPVLAARLSKRAWPGAICVVLAALAVAWPAALQPGPPLTIEASEVELIVGDVASRRSFVTAPMPEGNSLVWTVNLDSPGPRLLPRQAPARVEYGAWMVDEPDSQPMKTKPVAYELRAGSIAGEMFRNFAVRARRGQTSLDDGQALVLDWWLEASAYRGRDAALRGAETETRPLAGWDNAHWRFRGAISVTPLRQDR